MLVIHEPSRTRAADYYRAALESTPDTGFAVDTATSDQAANLDVKKYPSSYWPTQWLRLKATERRRLGPRRGWFEYRRPWKRARDEGEYGSLCGARCRAILCRGRGRSIASLGRQGREVRRG